jgi:hypothetical protein
MKEIYHLEGLDIDGKITLKSIIKTRLAAWTGLAEVRDKLRPIVCTD